MANMYARYNVVGRIVNAGKNEYFCFEDRQEMTHVKFNRAQTAYLIGKEQVANMTCTVNIKGGVSFEVINGQIRQLPIIQDITKKEIPESEKYKIIAILKNGKNTIGYRVQRGRDAALNLQPVQIAELDRDGKLANAKLVNQNGKRILVGVNTNLRDLPVYQPGDLMAEQKTGKLQGQTNTLKELIGSFQTTRVPPIYKQRVLVDGQEKIVYQYTGKIDDNLVNPEHFAEIVKNKEFKCTLYAIVLTSQKRVNQYGIMAGFAGKDKASPDELRRLANSKNIVQNLITEGMNRPGNESIQDDYAMLNNTGKVYIYRTTDRRKQGDNTSEDYYTMIDQSINMPGLIDNHDALNNYFKQFDKRALGDIQIAQTLDLLRRKDRIIQAMTGKQLGLQNTDNSVETGRKLKSQRASEEQVQGQNVFQLLDREAQRVIQILSKNTKTTWTQQIQTWVKDSNNTQAQKIATFNTNGVPKFKIRFLKYNDAQEQVVLQVIRLNVSQADPNRSILVKVNAQSDVTDQDVHKQLHSLLKVLNGV